MLFIPKFLKPQKNLKRLLRTFVGVDKNINIQKLLKSVDVYNEPLPLVFLLTSVIYKFDKKQLTPQLAGVISHERFRNAMHMAAFQRVCKKFNENNIAVLAQKGLVQKILYPQSTRPMNDADFTVPKNVYRYAIDLAKESGFHITHDMMFSADMQFKDQGCIDIHYSVFKGANPKMDDDIFYHAKAMNFMGCNVLIPCPEDILVIIMCEFYGNFLYEAGSEKTNTEKIFASHPQWVLDAYKIICEHPNLNWGKVMRTAKMSGYDYQIKLLTMVLNSIIPGSISKHAKKVIDFSCPDEVVKRYLKRDKKIIYLHWNNHKYLAKQGL